jgi:hypothetical protein
MLERKTMSVKIERVRFKNKKRYDEIMKKVMEAIEGNDKKAVENALDKILQLYPSSTKIII